MGDSVRNRRIRFNLLLPARLDDDIVENIQGLDAFHAANLRRAAGGSTHQSSLAGMGHPQCRARQIIFEAVAGNHRSGRTSARSCCQAGRGYLTRYPSFTSARLREPWFQPLRGSPQLARLPAAEASNADRQRVNAVRCARSSRMNAQTPASVFNGPEHWRQRAEEARRMADLMSNIPSKEAMLRIAEDYEHLAEWAEERAKRSA